MSLRNFIMELEQDKGELLVIRKELSAKYEVAAVIKKFDSGPALYFQKIKQKQGFLVANICSTREKICKALKTTVDKLHEKIINATRSPKKPKLIEFPFSTPIGNSSDINILPILTHYEKDPGPYITAGIVFARDPVTGFQNASIHRMLVIDKNHLAIRIVPRHLHKIVMNYWREKRDVPVAIAIGVHPAVLIASSSPVPYGVNELYVANTLLDGTLKTTICPNTELEVPVGAEIILEGKILYGKEVDEGPFVDLTGTYDIVRKQPVIKIEKIYLNKDDFIYQAILPAGSEHKLLMGLPREAKIWDVVKSIVPDVRGVYLTLGGCGWLHAVVSIRKQSDGDAKNVILAAFAGHPSLKHVIVVDDDVNPYDMEEVEWAIATRFNASQDLIIIPNVRGSSLDPSADQVTLLTTKMGIDATRPFNKPKEKFEKAKIPVEEKIIDNLTEEEN